MNKQTVLLSLFNYSGLSKAGAFARMGFPPLRFAKIRGLEFWRPFGTGGGNGFSLKPDWSTYGLLTVFDSEDSARQFLSHKSLKSYEKSSDLSQNLFLHNFKAHGSWGGSNPFRTSTEFDPKKRIAVITRATIKPSLAAMFWSDVPDVSGSMDEFNGCIYAKGVGEWPVFMQATVSVWENSEAMKQYAYGRKGEHIKMVQKTRETGWYREELFSRFHIQDSVGELIPGI